MTEDEQWLAAVRRAARPFDEVGNRLRRRWLASVQFDSDGCWIWTGPINAKYGTPVFGVQINRERMPGAAFSWFYRLWVGTPPGKLTRYRLCGKRLCVRPACGSAKRGYPTRKTAVDWSVVFADMDQGMSFTEAVKVHRVTPARLTRAIRVAGRADTRAKRVRRTPEFWAEVRRRWYAGATMRELSSSTGVSTASIASRMHREQWPARQTRDWSQARALRAAGATYREVSEATGWSVSTLTARACEDKAAGDPWVTPGGPRPSHDWSAARALYAQGADMTQIAKKMDIALNHACRQKYLDKKAGRPWLRS
jgi:uncharacterized protein YerC